jgi:hypothetical protein
LYVDQPAEVQIDVNGDAEIRYTTDGSLPNRNSKLYQGKFNLNETAIVSAKAFSGEDQESDVSRAYFRMVKKSSNNGIRFKYYESKKELDFLPSFPEMKPVKSGLTYEFRVDSINEVKYQFGIRYSSHIQIEKEGEYRFYLNSDDGSRLYINDEMIVDNDGGHGPLERVGNLELKPGLHKIMVDYHNQNGGGWLDAFYKGPGIPKQIIPANKLFLK